MKMGFVKYAKRVKHLLMECTGFTEETETVCSSEKPGHETISLKKLLNPTENQPGSKKAVLEFIKATGLLRERCEEIIEGERLRANMF